MRLHMQKQGPCLLLWFAYGVRSRCGQSRRKLAELEDSSCGMPSVCGCVGSLCDFNRHPTKVLRAGRVAGASDLQELPTV